jgi:bla regulator protein BlaR1
MITISISDRLIRALCDTLMHSLWQGLLLAAVAGLTVICTRKASSALRYNLLVSALILFSVGTLATFAHQFLTTAHAVAAHRIDQPADIVRMVTANPVTQPATAPATTPKPAFTDRITAYLNDHHNTIVLVWFLIICARSIQLGVGLYGTYRLKHVRVSAVKDRWPERIRQLAMALGIRQTISLLESGLAKAPMMIGHLKPVVLVPVGLLTALSPAEVEAILIHELAHIKRRDYLVNLLQNLTEIVFFFNPAVLWISTLIRTERENCCDDLALAHDNNKATYIRALVSCEEYQSPVPPYAMAFPGSRNTLLHRVRRLVSNRNHSLNLFEKTVLTICLIGAGLFVTAFSVKKAVPNHPVHAISSPVLHPTKTVPGNSRSTVATSVQRSVAVYVPTMSAPTDQNQKPEGVQLPATQPNQPTETVAQPTDTRAQPKHDTAVAPTIPDLGDTLVKYNIIPVKTGMTAKLNSSELLINGVKQPEAVHTLIYSKFLNINGQSVNIDYVYKDTRPDTYNAPYGQSNRASYNDQAQQPLDRRQQALDRERQALYREQEALNREQQALDRERQASDQNQNYSDQHRNYSDQQQKYMSDEAAIKLDLIKEGLVSDTNHIHFTINEKEFILNGVKQNPEVHQRYLDKYCPAKGAAGWGWSHGTNRP